MRHEPEDEDTMESCMPIRVPVARVDGLVVTVSNDEVLVYDTESHHLHHLNRLSAVVWRLCDGQRTVDDLVRQAQCEVDGVVTSGSVRLALTKLASANLLDGETSVDHRDTGQSRRAFLRRAATTGAIAVPVIVSISAPQAAAATSTCLTPGQCSASTVGQICATNPANCATSALRCWPTPFSPGSFFCGAQP
jgi:hypothetical protein